MLEFGPVQLFNGSIECITVNVNDRLTEISRQLKLRNVLISSPEVRSKIDTFQLPFTSEDLFNLVCKVLVLVFFVVEVLGALGGVVYNL